MFSRDEIIWTSAVRYALDSKNYVIKTVVEYMMRRLQCMSPSCRSIMMRDIEERLRLYPPVDDQESWMKLLEALKESLDGISR